MPSRCLLGDGWGVEGVEGEGEEAGGCKGPVHGFSTALCHAVPRSTPDAQRSTLNRNANADEFSVQHAESRCRAGQGRAGQGRVSGATAVAEGSGPSGPCGRAAGRNAATVIGRA
jgi:hypothetical protein